METDTLTSNFVVYWRKKVIQIWYNKRVGKWQDFRIQINYYFKIKKLEGCRLLHSLQGERGFNMAPISEWEVGCDAFKM